MFTGLIEEVGEIVSLTPVGDSLRLTVRASAAGVLSDAQHGDSISVSGVCLTVVEQTRDGSAKCDGSGSGSGTFSADVMAQSLRMSTLGDLEVGSPVNLERAARVDSRLGGHIVQGHVDGIAEVTRVTPGDAWQVLRFTLPAHLAPLLVDKGSVTLAGVSLTVSAISEPHENEPWFEVSLIPETLAATTLGDLTVGDRVNLETDILARHVARMLRFDGFASQQSSESTTPAPTTPAPKTPEGAE